MSHAAPEFDDEYEAWRDLQDVLEDREREYWAEESVSPESDDDPRD